MSKRSLRQELLQLRAQLSVEAAAQQAILIQRRFVDLPEFVAARTVALYSPVRGEVDTAAILQRVLACGKRAVYPRLVGAHLEFVAVTDPAQLHPGAFGIPEPRATQALPLADIDLMAVPGIAFDRFGHRLGYGKGCYDRLLSHGAGGCCLAGLAFDLQLRERLPAEGHDVRMDLILTAAAVLRFDHTASREGHYHTHKED